MQKNKNEKKLNWDNLEEGKCPKCEKKLELFEGMYECSSFDCSFRIREWKALEILEEMEGNNSFFGEPSDFYD